MAEVFLSYAHEDRDRAAMLARALGALGWAVWWDRRIIVGQAFDQAIERELEAAKCVVVLWSKHSIASEWVKNEAAAAADRGVLVPALIDSVKLPLEFRRRQTAELIDWKGEPSHSGFQSLCDGIASAIGGDPRNLPVPGERPKPLWSRRWLSAGIAAMVVAFGLGIYLAGPWRPTAPTPIPHATPSEGGVPSESKPPVAVGELADLVVGSYFGNVISDSKGSSRSDIDVAITKMNRYTVRVTSNYHRLGTVDVPLTRSGNQIVNAGGDSPFMVDLGRNPPTLTFNPHNELTYAGTKRK
jgi:hypothetical protein